MATMLGFTVALKDPHYTERNAYGKLAGIALYCAGVFLVGWCVIEASPIYQVTLLTA